MHITRLKHQSARRRHAFKMQGGGATRSCSARCGAGPTSLFELRGAGRIATVLALGLVIAPLSILSLLGSVARVDVERDLYRAIDEASARYRAGSGLRASQRIGERTAQERARELAVIARHKRQLRLEVAALRGVLQDIEEQHGLDLGTPEKAEAAIVREREEIAGFLRYLYARNALSDDTGLRLGRAILERSMHGSLGESVERDLRRGVLAEARAQLFSFLVHAKDVPTRLVAAEVELAVAQEEYLQTLAEYEHARRTAQVSAARLAQIKQIMGEVHDEVLKLQGELARIDARIARRTERALIEKGLRSPRPGTHSDGETWKTGPVFSWPVYGPVSAGFKDGDYAHFFGVPHYGMDIVVGQGTPVRAAADGVVFLARDGGETGYSYLLVGHRGGYATLYGHLSAFSVSAGDDVSVGDVIATSGGQPGTYGAGPMTTGAHLHFEVILNGVNVDPRGLLP